MPTEYRAFPGNPEYKAVAELIAKWNSATRETFHGGTETERVRVLVEAGRVALCLWDAEFNRNRGEPLPSLEVRHERRQSVLAKQYETLREEGDFLLRKAFDEAAARSITVDERIKEITQQVNFLHQHLPDLIRDQKADLLAAIPGSDAAIVRQDLDELKNALKTLETTLARKAPARTLDQKLRSGLADYLKGGLEEIGRAPFTVIGLIIAVMIINIFLHPVLAVLVRMLEDMKNTLSVTTAAPK